MPFAVHAHEFADLVTSRVVGIRRHLFSRTAVPDEVESDPPDALHVVTWW